MSAGHGGQILLSVATAEVANDILSEGIGLRALGSHRLKDLTQPQPVFQLLHSDLTAEFPAFTTLDNRPNNLKTQPTLFVGRETEPAGILDLINQESARLITLTGPGVLVKSVFRCRLVPN